MKELIQALNIFLKYGSPDHPTWCEHDTLHIDIKPEEVSEEDKVKLEDLGFYICEDEEEFYSYKYGSC